MAEKYRDIQPKFNEKGLPYWSSVMTQPNDTLAKMYMVPDRVIPVIFVPGVMGSNLESKTDSSIKWLLDSPISMLDWAARNATFRKLYLTPQGMKVYTHGKTSTRTRHSSIELKNRGWGEVGYMSYGEYLADLENALNDFSSSDWQFSARNVLVDSALGAEKGEKALTRDEVALSYKYRFPVHACGYNWLESNVASAEKLQQCIRKTIAQYRQAKMKCEKVIIVTHSMGGLVARYCSEILGMREQILGIVHGVMPAIGAAALYRRMKAGTENGGVASMILGQDAAEMTAVLSGAPGPLQLLPTPEYGNGWLRISDERNRHALPQRGDPYGEIYTVRGKWWSLCEDHLMNPLNTEKDPAKFVQIVDKNWLAFTKIIEKQVKDFHGKLKGKYHPNTHAFYGSHPDTLAYGNVCWTGKAAIGENTLAGGRSGRALDARALDASEVDTARTVSAPLKGQGWKTGMNQTYTISKPDELGDGTVPQRSGRAPQAFVKALLQVRTEHEPAFRDCVPARLFTLRAIVQIAQDIRKTALAYPS